jgi:hypothetical protein
MTELQGELLYVILLLRNPAHRCNSSVNHEHDPGDSKYQEREDVDRGIEHCLKYVRRNVHISNETA